MHAKRTSTHFATTENLPNPVASVGRVLASHVFLGTLERIYLNDELWAMRKERGLCWESLRSRRHGCRSRGWGNCQQSSGLGQAGAGPAPEARCLTSSGWLHYSWGQCRLLVAAASSLGRCLKLFPSLLACSLRPSRNKRLCCYFPDDCVLMISFLTQAEKLQFHKEPVILINVLPTRVCPSQNFLVIYFGNRRLNKLLCLLASILQFTHSIARPFTPSYIWA